MARDRLVETGNVHSICGFPIREVAVERAGSYKLVARFLWGHELIIDQGHNPQEVRRAETRISRNPRVIESIELRDGSGTLETLWRHTWT